MKLSSKPLNKQAITLEEAETLLRILVKDEYFKLTPRYVIDSKANQIINEALKHITIPNLKEVAKQSLRQFYTRQIQEISRIRGQDLLVFLSLLKLTDKDNKMVKTISISRARSIVSVAIKEHNATYGTSYGTDSVKVIGQAFQEFSKEYFDKRVEPVFNRLMNQHPIVPGTTIQGQISHINTLRNRAEKEVRYHGHQSSIANFRQKGVKLVIASVHSNASPRCRPWQGRVFSLDHTSGTTSDGRPYVPLEQATDIPYTTRAGVTYMNGLLGFNCRHYLVEYKDGFRFRTPDPLVEATEYKIDQRQRYYEEKVREWRTKAVYYQGTNPAKYKNARQKANAWNKAYIDFSKANGRAYYPSRTKLI